MNNDFLNKIYSTHEQCNNCPRGEEVAFFFEQLLGLLFPNFASEPVKSKENLKKSFIQLRSDFEHLLREVNESDRQVKIDTFFDSIPTLYDNLLLDIKATYEGDPAAKSTDEVVRSYPGFYAIAAYRVAHQLQKQKITNIPRAITEYAHNRTGIDIHPSAEIGDNFCIDHGTGVVIGESTIIGDYVKIYQGVTLGALSVDKKDSDKKRHPTIEDHVVIYAEATILGGETVIGTGSVIGGNVWLTRSVKPNSKVYYQAAMHEDGKSPDIVVIK